MFSIGSVFLTITLFFVFAYFFYSGFYKEIQRAKCECYDNESKKNSKDCTKISIIYWVYSTVVLFLSFLFFGITFSSEETKKSTIEYIVLLTSVIGFSFLLFNICKFVFEITNEIENRNKDNKYFSVLNNNIKFSIQIFSIIMCCLFYGIIRSIL